MSTGSFGRAQRGRQLLPACGPAMLVGSEPEEGDGPPPRRLPRSAGGGLLSSVLIVGVATTEVEGMLAGGVGPGLPKEPCCPRCGGELRGFWRGYRRAVRFGRRVERLWIGRSVCRGCGRTHALLPSFVVPRRLDAAVVIGAALELAAAGSGYRPIAATLGLPGETVRGWLRRARTQATLLASRLWRLAQELGALAPRAPPADRPLAALVRACEAAHGAAARRLGQAGLPDRWGLLVVLAGEGLLSHRSSLFPAAPSAGTIAATR